MSEQPQHKFQLRDGHRMQFVFELDGVKYWEFTDPLSAPTHRMMIARDYYDEMEMRTSREFRIANMQAIKNCLDGSMDGKLDLVKAGSLVVQAMERDQFIFSPDILYKLASVVMIDESESPYAYDFKYNNEVKISAWKKHDMASFFLSQPLKRFLPQLTLSESDFRAYLKVLEKVEKNQLDNIFTTLSANDKTSAWFNTLESLRQEEWNLTPSDNSDGTTTTS